MEDVFDCAYENFCDCMTEIQHIALKLCQGVFGAVIYLTVPIWAIPYAIIKKIKERENDG